MAAQQFHKSKQVIVTLGEREYVLRPLKTQRVLRLHFAIIDVLMDVKDFAEALADFSGYMARLFINPAPRQDIMRSLEQMERATDALLRDTSRLYVIAIPGLDPRIFSENADDSISPDVFQLLRGFDLILEVNHLTQLQRTFHKKTTPPGPLDVPLPPPSDWLQ